MRLRLPVSPIFLVLLALLAYIGLRLTLPFGVVAQVAGGLAFASLLWLLPKGFYTRKRDSEWAALVPWLAMGSFRGFSCLPWDATSRSSSPPSHCRRKTMKRGCAPRRSRSWQ